MKTAIISKKLPAPAGPFSHVVESSGLVFTAGISPHDPTTGDVPEGVAAQTDQVITNLETVLAEVGLGLGDVVKTTAHLQNLGEDIAAYNEVYSRRFPDPFPVRTTVGSDLAGFSVEIDAVAIR